MLEAIRRIGPLRVKEVWFADMPFEPGGCELLEFHDCKRKYDTSMFKRSEAQTLVIDLTQSIDSIWGGFDKKACRYEINRAEREGIKVRCPVGGLDWRQFFQLNRNFRQAKGLGRTVSDSYIKDYGLVITAVKDDEILAGQVYLRDETTMRWLLGASIPVNPLVSAANRALTWFAIQLAKSEGKKEFDFGGYDETKYPTISFFKKSFGGEIRPRYNYSKWYIPPIVADVTGGVWDVLRGLDIRGVSESVGEGYHSSPSGDRYLRDVLRSLAIQDGDKILDIGCGKGSAMLTMLKYPFAQVDGVELSRDVAKLARQNLRRFGTRARVYDGDARHFDGYEEYNMAYLYNPFPESIMRGVMSRLSYSVAVNPRKMTVIYNNPTCHEVVSGFFHKVAEYPNRWGTGIYVYRNTD